MGVNAGIIAIVIVSLAFGSTGAIETAPPSPAINHKPGVRPARPGKLTITARLLYRKADQYLLNFIFGEASGLTSPITEMAIATREVIVGEPSAD